MRTIVALRKGFWWAETALVCGLLLGMVGVSALPIVARWTGWRVELRWADAYLKHSVLWITVLGAALATKDRNHINIDVVGRLLKGRWKSACLVLTNFFAAAVCAEVASACFMFVRDERLALIHKDFSATPNVFGSVPAWCAQAVLPLAFALMAGRFFVQSIEDAIALSQGKRDEPAPSKAEPDEEGAEA